MTVQIRLTGEAAAQAQGLVAELLSEGIDVRTLTDEDKDRSIESLATDFTVALVAEATYNAIRDLVRVWLQKRQLDQSGVELESPDNDDTAE